MDAKLSGIGCEYISAMAFANGPVSNRLLRIEYERVERELAKRERRFVELASGKMRKLEWRASSDYSLKAFADQLRAIDLLILGPNSKVSAESHFNPATIILQAGRPVLFVPDDGKNVRLQKILIAWKDSRESRRALADSLPYLKKAKNILLLGIQEDEQSKAHIKDTLSDVSHYLAHHGIACKIKAVQPAKKTAAEQILSHAKKFKPDLIVAGAYGRSRIGEWVFGDVTKTLVDKSLCACLFSH
jgi:nucleotide-binding universal stress UspA family protein